jgi:hypothetical protein
MDDVSAAMTHTGQTHAPDDHAGHDRQLVVAYACGDLPGEDVADARSLVARCRRCAALVDEIALISTATRRDLVAPPRSRDFRLTSDDAERLRGNAISRLLRHLGSPRLQVLQPLAGAAMAIGLVLMLTTSVLPSFFTAAGAAPVGGAALPAAAEEDAAARDAAGGEGATSGDGASGGAEVAPAGPLTAPAASPQVVVSPDVAAYTETDTSTKANVTELTAQVAPVEPVAPVGFGLLIVGAVVLLVRVVARRATKDPLLR